LSSYKDKQFGQDESTQYPCCGTDDPTAEDAENHFPVDRLPPPGQSGTQHGFGHTALGRNAKGRGSAFETLNLSKSDPLSGQAVHKEICVRVYKA
jgi:hypothetical protein